MTARPENVELMISRLPLSFPFYGSCLVVQFPSAQLRIGNFVSILSSRISHLLQKMPIGLMKEGIKGARISQVRMNLLKHNATLALLLAISLFSTDVFPSSSNKPSDAFLWRSGLEWKWLIGPRVKPCCWFKCRSVKTITYESVNSIVRIINGISALLLAVLPGKSSILEGIHGWELRPRVRGPRFPRWMEK